MFLFFYLHTHTHLVEVNVPTHPGHPRFTINVMHACIGKKYFIWFGTKARLSIVDPALAKEVLSRPNEFRRPSQDQMAEVLVGGLFTTKGDIWAKHKKILNPSFNIEKIKVAGLFYTIFFILYIYNHRNAYVVINVDNLVFLFC